MPSNCCCQNNIIKETVDFGCTIVPDTQTTNKIMYFCPIKAQAKAHSAPRQQETTDQGMEEDASQQQQETTDQDMEQQEQQDDDGEIQDDDGEIEDLDDDQIDFFEDEETKINRCLTVGCSVLGQRTCPPTDECREVLTKALSEGHPKTDDICNMYPELCRLEGMESEDDDEDYIDNDNNVKPLKDEDCYEYNLEIKNGRTPAVGFIPGDVDDPSTGLDEKANQYLMVANQMRQEKSIETGVDLSLFIWDDKLFRTAYHFNKFVYNGGDMFPKDFGQTEREALGNLVQYFGFWGDGADARHASNTWWNPDARTQLSNAFKEIIETEPNFDRIGIAQAFGNAGITIVIGKRDENKKPKC